MRAVLWLNEAEGEGFEKVLRAIGAHSSNCSPFECATGRSPKANTDLSPGLEQDGTSCVTASLGPEVRRVFVNSSWLPAQQRTARLNSHGRTSCTCTVFGSVALPEVGGGGVNWAVWKPVSQIGTASQAQAAMSSRKVTS